MNKIIETVKKFPKDIRSKFLSNYWDIQHGNQILSYDHEMMRKYKFSPFKTFVNFTFYILFMIVPGVSIS